jgi:hypothetical protein
MLGAFVTAMSMMACASAQTTPAWENFVEQSRQGKATDIPDYSWAGYERGEKAIPVAAGKRFDVTDYGAKPDDLVDDRDAIQKAIDAAAANGGGVVYLPAGRYLVNTDFNDRGTIRIEASNIILKGAGSRQGGTIIHQIQPFGKGDPYALTRMHLGDNILLIHSRDEERSLSSMPVICKVTGDSPAQAFNVTVDNASDLKVGQYVYLYALNNKIIERAVKPFAIDEEWTTTTQNKAYIVEIHQVAKITGNTVTFAEPIRYDILASDQWDLRQHNPIANVGIEDITFMGNHWHHYKHHRSGMDDSGWAMIKIKGVTNSYVQRCSFLNVSQALYVSLSSYVTAMNITQAGNTSHHSPRISFYTYGILAGLIDDQAGSTHGPSLNAGTVGTVFWRWKGVDGSIDSHAGRPFCSLYDCIDATHINSSGGRRSYPQHLRDLMLWNVHMISDKPQHYDFWQPKSNNVFVMPNVVGMHGGNVTFNKEHVGLVESLGQKVSPESLYEAQLALRLGKLPKWVSEVQAEQKALENKPLVTFYDRNDPSSPTWFYPETFNVNDMLGYLTKLSLQMMKTKLYTYDITDKSATLYTDQSFVRHTLYALMCAIYQQQQSGNTITAKPVSVNGKPGFEFVIASAKLSKPARDLSDDDLVIAAKNMGDRIGITIERTQTDEQIVFVVTVPQMQSH